ncbi:hypothetical protein GRI97_00730 [Altererythrobacter xixiisoli]|uniref:ATP-binding protein n=1 Tax=Croceibacterium xixiisoli TaxID=1476466 RepID=A0A6I4TNQ5_9SPHN|nr:YncE family protein [Croceibacterium xixiisoli]MXO97512.1 hypothetical protein [Croceibacterium xixiisoli]
MASLTHRFRRSGLSLLIAGSLLAGASVAHAQAAFTTLDRNSEARVNFSAAERGKPIEAGSQVTVSGEGFQPNQKVALYYGAEALAGGALTANAEGKIEGSITVPANAVYGTHPIVVVAQGPYSAQVAELKVSPTVPLSGQSNFTLTEAQAARGLYQSAFSAKNNALFVTSAVGRPPVRDSELLKLNAETMAIIARISPAAAPARPGPARPGAPTDTDTRPGLFAVYGVGVDDAHDTVWVTNTRQNTVGVYRQSNLELVKQFAPETVGHPRDVVVDQSLNKAFVSATGHPEVVVFNTANNEVAKTITIQSGVRGEEFSAASQSLDATNHKLYVVSLSTAEVAIINTQTDAVEKVLRVPGVRQAIGVSNDPQTGRIFVAAQGSDNLVVLDGNTGNVIADTPIGAGALNVAFDPVKRLAYVANRGAGTIAVTDVDGKIVANLGPAPMANHVSVGPNGTVFAVDKSAAARGEEGDTVLRIRPR